MRFLVLLLCLVLSGCVTPGGRWLVAHDAQGNAGRVLHLDGVPCPSAITTAPNIAGCYYNGPVVFTAGGETAVRGRETLEHELEHHAGLMHGPWVRTDGDDCARIFNSGRTGWKKGALLCRGERYYQREAK